MAKLADLSNEIILHVVSYLTTGNEPDVEALFHLCRTSHRLFDIAQPALYTCVKLVEPAAEPLGPLKKFLRTVIERPSLAGETQQLALFNDRGVRYEWPSLGNDVIFMELSALIGGHSAEIEPELCYYPLALEVLARLPNLQHLFLTAQIEHPHSLLQRVHNLQAELSVLSKLKTFHL